MLFGAATPESIAAYAPSVDIDPNLALDIGYVEWAQFIYELAGDRLNYDFLPPGLHPTIPMVAMLQIWRARNGALGDFGLAQLRLTCRAGMRIRGYLLQSVIDGEDAASTLTRHFGFGLARGKVGLRVRSDLIHANIEVDGRTVFAGDILEPAAVDPSSIQHVASMNPARSSGELTLLQIDPEFTQASLARGRQRITTMDNAFWRLRSRAMKYPVIGVNGLARIQIPPISYTTEPFPEQVT